MSHTSKRIYLDHSATTPLDSRVFESMKPFFTDYFGNASSQHKDALKAVQGLQVARRKIAQVLDCHYTEIIFTSGGTESDNLAIRGVAFSAKQAGKGNHIITSPIEHSAVSKTIEQLVQFFGFEYTEVPVNQDGMVDPQDVENAIQDNTVLISIMYANSEVGSIQPIQEIGVIAKNRSILFHSDAVQAGAYLDISANDLNVDLLSLSAHKMYGPKGIGILYVRNGTSLFPCQTGGPQENAKRAGTENLAGITGFATALELCQEEKSKENHRLQKLRDSLIQSILTTIPDSYLTGDLKQRLPGHASFVFKGVDADSILMHLDLAGISASSGSACNTGMPEPSNVLLAMGIEDTLALSALRLTLGRKTTPEELETVVSVLSKTIQKLRRN